MISEGDAFVGEGLAHHSRSDEILNGKTLDRNSNYFARFCFENGVEL